MSSGVADVYNDYRDYLKLCEAMQEEPRGDGARALAANFYEHWERLKNEAPCTCGGGRSHVPHCPQYWI